MSCLMNEQDAVVMNAVEGENEPDPGSAHYWPVALILLAGVFLSIFFFLTARQWEREHIRDDFEKNMAQHVAAFRQTLDLAIHELGSLHAFYDASEQVTRAEFRVFARDLLRTNPTIQALEWIPRVRREERAAYLETARADGYPKFEILELDADGNLITAGHRHEYFPVYFVEPYAGNEAALGYDLASQPTRLQALLEARNTGKPQVSGRIRLVQEGGDQYGFLIFHPVYKKDIPLHSPGDRLRNLEGFVLAVFRIGDMLARTMQPLHSADIEVHLFDESAPPGEQLLSSYPPRTGESPAPASLGEAKLRTGIHSTHSIEVLGRKWLLLGRPTPRFLADRSSRQPWTFLLGGLLLTGLLSGIFWLRIRQHIQTRQWADRLVQSKRELEDEAASRRRVQKDLDQRVRTAEMRVQVGQALTKGANLEPMLQECAEALASYLELDVVRIWTVDQPRTRLQLQASAGLALDSEPFVSSIPVGAGPVGNIAATREPYSTHVLFQDGRQAGWDWVPQENLTAFAGYPLVVENRIAGVLGAFSRSPINPVTEKALASVADAIAVGVTRKETEELLRRERDRIQSYLDVAGVMLLVLDADGRVALINRQGCQILEREEEEIVGKNWFATFLPLAYREEVSRVFHRLMAGDLDGVEYFENPIVTGTGEEKLIAWHNTLLQGKAGTNIGTLSSGEDITARRKLEDEQLKMQKLESVGVLAGGLAHDFNNLLTGIVGNIGLAKLSTGARESIERLTEAEKASLRARDLIQQLLTFSKGGAPIRRSVSIEELVRESAGFALRGSNVACEYRVAENLWPVSVDESQISQVIHNLVLNAAQSMPGGGTVTVSLGNMKIAMDEMPSLKPGDYVVLSVADRGMGISREELPRIFDPYFSKREGGSGLGLATVYSIVQRHHGHIDVDSEVNGGTTFRVYLPATPRTAVAKEAPAQTLITGRGRVLIMDDDELIHKAAGEMLRRLGYDVALARDGDEALEKCRQARADNEPLDLVIMDLTIPGGMGGKEAVRKLREIDPEVRTIVSSGYSSDPVMAEAEKYGFNGVIAKPYGIAELSRVLDDVMQKRSLSGPQR